MVHYNATLLILNRSFVNFYSALFLSLWFFMVLLAPFGSFIRTTCYFWFFLSFFLDFLSFFYLLVLFQVELIPIRNEAELVVLFLCNYRDITAFKVRQHLSGYLQQQGDHLRQKLCISYKVDTIAISFVSIKW